jgi:elongation factor Ts
MLRRSLPFFQAAAASTARVDISLVKELRFRTDAPLGDCQAALKDSNGDMDMAIEWLKKKGAAKVVKVGGRVTAHGAFATVASLHHGAFILQLGTETDFAARNLTFLAASDKVKTIAEELLVASNGQLLTAPPEDILRTLQTKSADIIASCVGVMGENVSLRQVYLLKPPVLPLPGEKITDPALKTFLYGKYTHNALGGFNDVGSVVGVTCVVGNVASADAAPAAVPLIPTLTGDVNDLAQHVVGHLGETSNIVHQSFLGSAEETVGKWLKKRGLRFGSAMLVDAKFAAAAAEVASKATEAA